MATRTLVSVDEYLDMTFEGTDAEYVDGEIVERSMPEEPHSKVQVRLIQLFTPFCARAPLHLGTELRLRVSATRVRVADFVVVQGDEPSELVPTTPPLVIAEIVSRHDSHTEITRKLEEYRDWGVAHVWLIDPWVQRLYVFKDGDFSTVQSFRLPELGVEISRDEIFR